MNNCLNCAEKDQSLEEKESMDKLIAGIEAKIVRALNCRTVGSWRV